MNKSLYLLRHSYAEPPGDSKDIDRPLTTHGHSVARSLGRYLLSQKLEIDQIVCSPARRTMATATDLIEELQLAEQLIKTEEVIYEASVRELLQVINGLDDSLNKVLMVGHNPAISFIAEYITDHAIETLDPCSFVSVASSSSWSEISKGTCTFIDHFHPLHS